MPSQQPVRQVTERLLVPAPPPCAAYTTEYLHGSSLFQALFRHPDSFQRIPLTEHTRRGYSIVSAAPLYYRCLRITEYIPTFAPIVYYSAIENIAYIISPRSGVISTTKNHRSIQSRFITHTLCSPGLSSSQSQPTTHRAPRHPPWYTIRLSAIVHVGLQNPPHRLMTVSAVRHLHSFSHHGND
ncbi:hypothetical protein VTJ04DRAFT_2222 [Mycothermus thermophilus]|uniref:uncharacterized protein n=1 Tax=Humicola insolens TaxID=85995 RepID=UPI003743E6AA